MFSFYHITRLLVIGSFCLACAGHKTLKTEPDYAAIHDFLKEVNQIYPVAGMSVAIVAADTMVIYNNGFADSLGQIPVTDSTVFYAGTSSELVISTALAQLASLEEFDLHENVSKRLPYFLTRGSYEDITVHHLLTHTSGIPHFDAAWAVPDGEPGTLESTTKSISEIALEFEPGQQCRRSPYNYDIAADWITKAKEKPLGELVHEMVFEPLGMTHSCLAYPAEEVQFAWPHRIENNLNYSLKAQDYYPYSGEHLGSNGLHTTSLDLAKWMRSLMIADHKSLTMETTDQMFKAHYKTGVSSFKGYGWEIEKRNGTKVYNMAWNNDGFSGDITLFAERQLGVVVLTNSSDDFNASAIRQEIENVFNGGKIEQVKMPAHIALGRAFDKNKDITETLLLADSLLCEASQVLVSDQSLCKFGQNLIREGISIDAAQSVFSFCLDKFPVSPLAHFNLAYVWAEKGEMEPAWFHYEHGIKLAGSAESLFPGLLQHLEVASERTIAEVKR